ncbi:MAG: hypothetical protein R3B72_00125 [Polyangiaceae bacterium]
MRRWTARHGLALLGAGLLLVALAPRPAVADEDLSGVWVMTQVTVSEASVPVVGTIHPVTTVVSLLRLKDDGKRLRGKGDLCQIEVDSGSSFVTTKLPAAFIRSLPRPQLEAKLDRQDDGTRRLRQAKRTVVVGAKLERPDTDPLPTEPKDARVIDQDGDGKPGVTVLIEGIVSGEIYVTQRSWTRLSGTQVGREGFAGSVEFGNEQSILEATSSMLDDPPDQRPLPDKSWFRMTRLSGDATCATARAVAKKWLQ